MSGGMLNTRITVANTSRFPTRAKLGLMHQSTGNDHAFAESMTNGAKRQLPDLVGPRKRVLRRLELLVSLAAACAMLIPVSQHDIGSSPLEDAVQWLAVSLIMLSMYVTYRRVGIYIRGETSRAASLARDARLKGAALAANTLRHHIANKLAVAVGYSEFLLEDPSTPADIQVHAHKILNSTLDAAKTMHGIDARLLDLDQETRVAGPPLLNLGVRDSVAVSRQQGQQSTRSVDVSSRDGMERAAYSCSGVAVAVLAFIIVVIIIAAHGVGPSLLSLA